MSWDVMIHRFEGPPPRVEDLSDEHQFLPLGDASDVRKQISVALPTVDWSDPAWGVLDGDGFSIEFNFQADGPVTGFMLHVRGGGDPLPSIIRLCRVNGWVALDTSAGAFLDLDAPSREGWHSFQSFRDQVVRRVEQEEGRRSWLHRVLARLRN
jgi:hypothetical protein